MQGYDTSRVRGSPGRGGSATIRQPRQFVENFRLPSGTTLSIYNELYHPTNGANSAQGDCLLLEGEDGTLILCDGGMRSTIKSHVRKELDSTAPRHQGAAPQRVPGSDRRQQQGGRGFWFSTTAEAQEARSARRRAFEGVKARVEELRQSARGELVVHYNEGASIELAI